MYEESQAISILSETECWNLLSSVALGRLVTSVDGRPDIFPVNFVVQHRTVLFRTAEGAKLVSTAINDHVLFEADDHGVTEGWSVIVKGRARMLRTDDEIDEAERAQLLPWTATVKQHFVRIRPLSVRVVDLRLAPSPTAKPLSPEACGDIHELIRHAASRSGGAGTAPLSCSLVNSLKNASPWSRQDGTIAFVTDPVGRR